MSFKLECRSDTISVGSSSNSVWLRDLAFIDQPHTKAQKQVSILSLSSSFVMLAAAAADSSEVILMLMDVQYGVVLHSTTLPTPTSMSKSEARFSVRLEKGNASQALLILSTLPGGEGPGQQRSSVFVVPFTIPERSTIANAMAGAVVGCPWLAPSEPLADDESEGISSKSQLLDRMKTAMEENKPLDADVAFFRWLKPRESLTETSVKGDNQVDGAEKEDMEVEKGEVKTKSKSSKVSASRSQSRFPAVDTAYYTRSRARNHILIMTSSRRSCRLCFRSTNLRNNYILPKSAAFLSRSAL